MKKIAALAFLLITAGAAQAQTINNLGAAAAVSGTDILPCYQGANPAKGCTASQIRSYIYTEGTWTPGITAATTPGTPTYATQTGNYQRIGNAVFVQGRIEVSSWAGTPSGQVTITGLPITPSGTGTIGGACSVAYWSFPGGVNVSAPPMILIGTTTSMNVYYSASQASSPVTVTQSGTTPFLYFSCQYRV